MAKVKLTLVKDKDGNTKLAVDYHSDDDLPSEHNENHIKLVRDLVGSDKEIKQDSDEDDGLKVGAEEVKQKQVIKSST
jgi:hypothetical protein